MSPKSKKSILKKLISALPEVYQPIYKHPELTSNVSRECQDRLEYILQVYDSLVQERQRPLNVLDLGTAQGYFSFKLAEIGANVDGVDYLEENVAVCNELAIEHMDLKVSFQVGLIEDVLQQLEPGKYDLVLGLSVFHHIVQVKGAEFVAQLLSELSSKVEVGIFEFAQSTEPMYWAEAQPVQTRELLNGFAFVHELSQHETHLSSVARPLYFASNYNWYLNNRLGVFKSTQSYSHVLAKTVHQGTRQYYFGNGYIVKQYRLDNTVLLEANIEEYLNEVKFLTEPPSNFNAPDLVLHGKNDSEVWIVREKLPGDLLLDIIRQKKTYEPSQVLRDIIEQLVILEEVGLYHNDVRVWNVLINTNGAATLFDYGAISETIKDVVWPYDIFLAFIIFVHEVTTGKINTQTPIRSIDISPFRLIEPYRKWMIAFWSRPVEEWSFRLLLELFLQRDTFPEYESHCNTATCRWEQAMIDAVGLLNLANQQSQNENDVSKAELKAKEKETAHLKAHTRHLENEYEVSKTELAAKDKETAHLKAHTQRLQNENDVSKAELKAKEKETAHLKAHTRHLENEYEASKTELAAKDKEAAHLKAHTQRLQNENDVSKAELKAKEKETAHLKAHTRHLENEYEVSKTELAAKDKETAHLKAHAQQLQNKIDASRVRIDELNHSSHHWWLESERLSNELKSVYKSNSWRIMWPLRVLSKFIKFVILLPYRLALRAIQTFKNIIKLQLGFGLTYLRKHPKLKHKVARLLFKFPRLNSRLRVFAQPRLHTESSVINPMQESSEPPFFAPVMLTENDESEYKLFNHSNDNQIEVFFPLSRGQRIIYYFVDHTILCPVNTGMQRVTRRLARGLVKSGESLCYVKWNAQIKKLVLINQTELSHLSQWDGPVISDDEILKYPASSVTAVVVEKQNLMQANWLMVPEVTHVTYQSHPVTLDVIMFAKQNGLKSVFIFYDAIPLKRTEFKNISLTHQYYMQQLLLVDLVIPISEWSANDLVSFWQIHDEATLTTIPKVKAVPLPGESQLTSRVITPLPDKKSNKLILSVGTVEPRKNQVMLVRAFERYCSENPKNEWKLVLVGNLHPEVADEIHRSTGKNSHIQHLVASDAELNDYYNDCAFTVYPSLEEGFGLPILESLWYAKPCICANFGAMAEVAKGGGCLTIDTSDAEELYRAILTLTKDSQLLDKLSREAMIRPIESWTDYSQHVSLLLDEESNPVNKLGNIYYWVDHTSSYPHNSGIQRVVRGLARSLIDLGLNLIPVKWDGEQNRFYSPTDLELEHLALWNGPAPSGWSDWVDPISACANDWMLIPELTSYLPSNHINGLKEYLTNCNLRCAWIFYDTIPWKMASIYSPESTDAHVAYMLELNNYELILSISMTSRMDFINFLNRTRLHTPNLEERVQSCVLPGEFQGTKRITGIKSSEEVVNILCVGTVEPRKNHLAVLKAFKSVLENTNKKVKLVIAGGAPFPDLANEVHDYIKNIPEILWETKVDDTKLHELYMACDFTVYPSLEEGFGLPILESLWNARPCVCNDKGAIKEAASGGGCCMIDVTDIDALSEAMLTLLEKHEVRLKLANEAINRSFKTWDDYALDVATQMAIERYVPVEQAFPATLSKTDFTQQFKNVSPRPVLSICISTYNRAEWLGMGLKYLIELLPIPRDEIEIVVCDNTSTDHTPEIVAPYLQRCDFHYYRNPENVGMLGNLRVTAHHAQGEYIWILGDDDLIKPGSIDKILKAIKNNPEAALIYLNYAYTHESSAKGVNDIDSFINGATPIVEPTEDICDYIKNISTESENFFTAIYCLVYRRDHALKAYSLNTEGRPFSTMLTCIPTTYYVLNYMMDEIGVWLGEPLLVVNMNVSWMKYAPLWILERIPEVYDLAQKMGASPAKVDRWRKHNLPGINHFFDEIYKDDPEHNVDYFSPTRLVSRLNHLDEFKENVKQLRHVYEQANKNNRTSAEQPSSVVFAAFE